MQTEEAIIEELFDRGIDFHKKQEWNQAIKCWKKAKKIFEEQKDKQGISDALYNLGVVYHDRGEWKRALIYYKKSLKIYEKLRDKQGISFVLGNLGLVYQNKGEWERALEYYNMSLKISEELGDKEGISYTFNNIGEINIINGNWEEARRNLEKSLTIGEMLAPIFTVGALINLGELWRLEGRYDYAMDNLEKAVQIIGHIGAKPKESDILEKLAELFLCHYKREKKEKYLSAAELYYDQALELANSLNMPQQEAIAIRGFGIIQAKKREITASKKSFIKSIEILQHLGAFFELQKTYLEYAKILYEMNLLAEAEMVVKSAAFDAKNKGYRDLLVKANLLLGDISMKQKNQYNYYLEALESAKFNSKIYLKTLFLIIFRMKKMEKQTLLEFIKSLKKVNKDNFFNSYLDALNAKIEGRDYDISRLPEALAMVI